jgi:type IV pilus assembly protein PilW
MRPTTVHAGRPQRGFSLVEVMISTVVALFATLAIMQSLAVSEGYRRTTASANDATFSGASATYLLSRDLQMAGYGVNAGTYMGCTASGIDEWAAPPQPFTFTLAPAQILLGANASTPDEVWIVSSGTSQLPGAVGLTVTMSAATDNYTVNNPYGITAGDVLLLAETGKACTITQASNTPVSGATSTVLHATGAKWRYNPGGGIGPVYDAGAVIMDLGTAPTVNRYYIVNNTLMLDQLVTDQLAQPVAANIVNMKAEYGEDPGATGSVTVWTTAAPAQWPAVLAIRVAVVARSAQPEKPSVTNGPCTTTTVTPIVVTWDDGTTTNLNLSGNANNPNWQCYRYKVFHTTVSLRNSIWTPS